MAQTSYAAAMDNNPIVVIGSQYCNPHPDPIDLAITRKVKTVKGREFVVSDVNGNLMFKVRDKAISLFHSKRLILDAQGNPLVTLKQKALTEHSRWNVFRGESTEDKDFLYTIKTTSIIQYKTKFAVFLANNTSKEKVCDFMVKGSWYERSCVIYAGDSSTIIAQMHKKITAPSLLIGKDNFMVTVYPNVDYAFIVSLIVILDSIFSAANDAALMGAAVGGAAVAVAAISF